MPSDKTHNIRIRCREETKQEWAGFASTFENHEAALEALLQDVETGYRKEESPF